MEIKKSSLKTLIKEVYKEEKQNLIKENTVRNYIRKNINTILNEFEDKNKNGISDEWESDPKNPMNMELDTSFGKTATVQSILKKPDHPDYQKAKDLLDKKKKDPKLQSYVQKKYGKDIEIGQEADSELPGQISPPGGQQPIPSTSSAAGEDEEDKISVFDKSDNDDGESVVGPEDEKPGDDPAYIYGDDNSEVRLPPFSRDLPEYWRKLASRGLEDKIATGKRSSTFVYKTKKKYHGKRLTPGGER
jgi:hypothetical protein